MGWRRSPPPPHDHLHARRRRVCGALAAGSYLVVRHNLLADSVDESAAQARRNLIVAPTYLREGHNALLAAYERGGDFLTVGIQAGQPFSSSFSVGVRQVPSDLRRIVKRGELGYRRVDVAGTRYLVVGGPSGNTELYFFFSEESVQHELAQLRTILLVGVGVADARGRARRRGARAQHAAPRRQGEHRGALAGRRLAGDAPAGDRQGRVRRLGRGVQRDGGGAGVENL